MPEFRRRVAILAGAILLAASACSTQFDTDNLSGDASSGSGSPVDGGGDDDGGDDGDGNPGGDAGGGGNQDGGGGGNQDASPPQPDGAPPADAGGGECGAEGQACCPPMDTDSCNDEFLECSGSGGICEACGNDDQPCCTTGTACNELLGLTCLLGECGLPL